MNAAHESNATFPDGRFTAAEIDAFRVLIEQLTGLHFDDWRLDTLKKTLLARMRARGIGHVQGYLDILHDSRNRSDELSALLTQITVNETYFFRYPTQFDFLRDHVLPALAARQRHDGAPIRIWSAGCSTGEEPYSIAMTALDVFGPAASHLLRISATDVSVAALEAARRAEYSTKSLRLADDTSRGTYFRRVSHDRFSLCDSLRRMVLFRESNLLDDMRRATDSWDIIFCRNVLIYFARGHATEILDGFHRCLSEHGYLFLGHSEILGGTPFIPCQPEGIFAFQKSAGQPRKPSLAEHTEPAARCAPTNATRSVETSSNISVCEVSLDTSKHPLDNSAEILHATAFASFEREDYARARSQLDRLLESFPRHLAATVLRANTYLNLGEHHRSVEECEVALQLDPFAAEAYLLLGMNFQKLAKPELAIAQLKKATYISPDSAIVQFHLGETYRALQMWAQATRAYRNAFSLLPASADREIQTYSGGFGRSAIETLCEQMVARCRSRSRDPSP